MTNEISFAIEAHAKVNHLYDGKPYSVHLGLVVHFGYLYLDLLDNDDKPLAIKACWLHDTIEDCRITYNDLVDVTAVKVADIVYALTNDKGKNRKERAGEAYYKGIRENDIAVFVKLCDRLANVLYSYESDNKKMFNCYKSEHEDFINSLFLDNDKLKEKYSAMVKRFNTFF